MESPLSEEQIRKISDITKLPPEKQQQELQNFLKTLSKEQIEFLKLQQQGQSCIFCSISDGKIESKKIYHDDSTVAVLDINPANPGHALVFPRRHVQLSTELTDNEVAQLFKVANKVATEVFKTVHAEGTNIFIANGHAAGQNAQHLLVHIIPRFNKDGIELGWKGKKISEKDLDDIKKKLEGKITFEQKVVKEEIGEFDIDAQEDYRLP